MRALIIGFGNELRGDDGVGPAIARAVEDWKRADVQAIDTAELTPELAAQIARSQHVMFVDADRESDTVTLGRCKSAEHCRLVSHAFRPWDLLQLAQSLYGRCPPAWLLSVPASEFGMGAALSARANRSVPIALDRIRCWIDGEATDA